MKREKDEDAVVVAPFATDPLYLPDNLVTQCADCFRMIQYRPHMRELARKIICVYCAQPAIEAGAKVITPQRNIEEAVAYFRRRLH